MLFRVDAGAGCGLGHLQRCLALAEALGRREARSVFLTQPSEAGDRIAATGSEIEPLDASTGSWDGGAAAAVAARRGCRIVIVDSYAATRPFYDALRAAGLSVVAIDDGANEPLPAHLVINAAPHAATLPYRSTTGDTKFLLGPRYALLRSEFRGLPVRAVAPDVRQVIVMVGGDDSGDVMTALIDALQSAAGSFAVKAIVGPFARNAGRVEHARERGRRVVELIKAPDSLCELLTAADLAISAGGQTLYELAATGTPAIAFEIAENQRAHLRAMAEAGAIKSAGHASANGFLDRLVELLNALVADEAARRRLSVAGQGLIDGLGADRAAEEILAAA